MAALFRFIWLGIKTGLRWVAPGAVGYVAGDIISNHEQSGAEDTLVEVARSAAGTASRNWVKWLMFMVVGVAVSIVAIVVFKLKIKK